jgi:hypothetical protein
MKRILVERGEVKRMAKLFCCSYQTVRNALRGFAECERAYRIREDALRAGGVEKPRRRVVSKDILKTNN